MNESVNASGNGTTNEGRPPSSKSYADFVDSLNFAQMVLTPILVLVGLIGNVLTIVVVRDRRFSRMNCTVMLLGLAVSDIGMLFTTSLNQTFMTSRGLDIRALSLFGCKLFFVVYRSAKVSSSWIIVLIAVERFFAVVYPHRSKTWMCRRNVLIMLSIIYAVAIGYNVLWSVTTVIKRERCYASIATGHEQLNFVLVLLRGIQYSFFSIAILICVTPPIIYRLIRTQQNRNNMVSGSAAGRTAKELPRTTAMLILVVVFHVVASLPFTILFVRSVFYGDSIFTSSGKEYLKFFLVSPTLEQVNHSVNFFIYVLFSRPFRQRLFEIVRHGSNPSPVREQHAVNETISINTLS